MRINATGLLATIGRAVDGLGPWVNRDPILLAGAPRTGTTWTARALSHGRSVRYIRGPLSGGRDSSPKEGVWMRYLTAADADPEYAAVWGQILSLSSQLSDRWPGAESREFLRRAPFWPARLLVKEVFCPLSLEWLEANFGMKIAITIRHPCGYVASALRQSGAADPAIRIESLLSQRRLMDRYFADDREWLAGLGDPIERIAAAYGMVYKVLGDQLTHHPEWTLVHHEALCLDPHAVFSRLLEAMRLRPTSRLRRFLTESTAGHDPRIGPLSSQGRRRAVEVEEGPDAFPDRGGRRRDRAIQAALLPRIRLNAAPGPDQEGFVPRMYP